MSPMHVKLWDNRDTFYRLKDLYDTGGDLALQEISRRKPIAMNRVAPEVETAVVKMATDNPALGQVRVASEMRKQAIIISLAGVRCVWVRHNTFEAIARQEISAELSEKASVHFSLENAMKYVA